MNINSPHRFTDSVILNTEGNKVAFELARMSGMFEHITRHLAKQIWETRVASDDPAYLELIGMAAEINSNNFDNIVAKLDIQKVR